MTRKVFVLRIVATVAVVLLCSGLAMADSLAERLEKGIYTEETVGDLDQAKNIYQQIVADAKSDRVVAAQAQFRLGQCLLKQQKEDEAMVAFKKLIEAFPDQQELVAKAKKHVPLRPDFEMLPEPWVDGELLQLQVSLASGLDIGCFVFSVNASEVDGKDVWLTDIGRYIVWKGVQVFSRVKSDRDTFRPLSSLFRHPNMGQFVATYSTDDVTVTTVNRDDGKQSTRTSELDGIYYDNEQSVQLFRRLPLTQDFKAAIPLFASFGEGAIEIEVEVAALETLEVPAGKFECYRLRLPQLRETYWISTDEHRYPVKFEAGGVVGVLDTIRVKKPGETIVHREDKLGYSLATPSTWYFVDGTDRNDDEITYYLLDPEAEARSKVVGVPSNLFVEHLTKKLPEQEPSARTWLEMGIQSRQKSRQDFVVRPDSWTERTVSGRPGVSYVADYIDQDKKMTYYVVCSLGGSTAVQFQTKIERDKFENFRGSFDAIIDSYKETSK